MPWQRIHEAVCVCVCGGVRVWKLGWNPDGHRGCFRGSWSWASDPGSAGSQWNLQTTPVARWNTEDWRINFLFPGVEQQSFPKAKNLYRTSGNHGASMVWPPHRANHALPHFTVAWSKRKSLHDTLLPRARRKLCQGHRIPWGPSAPLPEVNSDSRLPSFRWYNN